MGIFGGKVTPPECREDKEGMVFKIEDGKGKVVGKIDYKTGNFRLLESKNADMGMAQQLKEWMKENVEVTRKKESDF